jgi:hypothetical protein
MAQRSSTIEYEVLAFGAKIRGMKEVRRLISG